MTASPSWTIILIHILFIMDNAVTCTLITEAQLTESQWRGIICKHNARWHHASQLKAIAFCFFAKKQLM